MQKIIKNNCPCCKSNIFKTIFSFKNIPQSGIYIKFENKYKFNGLNLEFELCINCGLVRQISQPKSKNYVEVNRSTSLQFPKYIEELTNEIKNLKILPSDFILEIGSNDGLFLDVLKNCGFTNILGVEPSKELCKISALKGHRVINNFFDSLLAFSILEKIGTPKLIICRHTLEHIPDPKSFINAIRKCFQDKNGLLLLEVPDGSAIPQKLNFYELWDEHLFYFSPNNLVHLLESSGFELHKLQKFDHLDTRNVITWSSATVNIQNKIRLNNLDIECVTEWSNASKDWHNYVSKLLEKIKKLSRPIFAIGASHSQTNFLNFSGLDAYVDYLIDDDPIKKGQYVFLKSGKKRIISSADFEEKYTQGSIIKTGFGYSAWTQRLCGHAKNYNMGILEPKDSIQIR